MDRRLFELLPRCTAKLSIPGKAGYGTGFFVANGLILTCAHVVKDTENIPIKVCWQDQEDFAEAVIDFYLPDPYDLALLRFTPPISDLPCVYLEESVQPEDKLYCYGYTDNFPQGESVTFECEGFTGDNPSLLKFKDGQTRPGLSGSPLLNLRTGKVCGMVKFTRDRSSNLGGGGVDISIIFSVLRELERQNHAFHQQDYRWTKLLSKSSNQIPLNRQEYHHRQYILDKVHNFWVKGVLETSLHNQVLIDLGLEEKPDAVTHPWNMVLQLSSEESKPLPQGTKLIDIYDEVGEGRTLLILGEPGSGKTTTLLELARDLIQRAEQDFNLAIPVVFNLSSWTVKQEKIEDWLVEELNSKYQFPKKLGESFIKEEKLLLLLDGLDEVKAEYREQCLDALNEFHNENTSEIVVCCRIKDYEALSNRLNFQSAVYLMSLTLEKIVNYLDSVGSNLRGLRTLIENDETLKELAKSPLMLYIITLAYQGVSVEDLPKTDVLEEHRQQLFDAYIEKMLNRHNRSKGEHRYSKQQTIHWLTWLAKRIAEESQTVFLIEKMQPQWISTIIPQWKFKIVEMFVTWLTNGIIFGLILSLCELTSVIFGVNGASLKDAGENLLVGFLLGVIYIWWYAIAILCSPNDEIGSIIPIETLKFSFKKVFIVTLSSIISFSGIPLVVKLFGVGRLDKPMYFIIEVGLKNGALIGASVSLLGSLIRGIIFLTKTKAKELFKERLITVIKDFPLVGFTGIFLGGFLGMIIGILFVMINGLIRGLSDLFVQGFSLWIKPVIDSGLLGLVVGLIGGLIWGLQGTELPTRTFPNQGIWNSAIHAIIFAAIGAGIVGLAYQFNDVISHSNRPVNPFYEINRIRFTSFISLMAGIVCGYIPAGVACLRHFSLRLILYHNSYIPWNYARFLDYATERIFLQKVGGGYIFIHRMLMEHFANMELEQK
jgi:hypothetical protein